MRALILSSVFPISFRFLMPCARTPFLTFSGCLPKQGLALLSALLLWTTSAQADVPFVVNGDGTVTDTDTGLMWDQCPIGQSDSDCATGSATVFDWGLAIAEAGSKSYFNWKGYSDWRLPSAAELLTIVKSGAENPSIDTTAFPGTPSSGFWSGSPHADSLNNTSWYVVFYYGSAGNSLRNATAHVRLVRGGQYFGAFSLTPGGVDAITTTTATLKASSPVYAIGYWLVVPRGSTPPTPAQVVAGANYGSVTIAQAGNADMTAKTEKSFSITNLTAGMAYDLYLVGRYENDDYIRSQLIGPLKFATTAISTNSIAVNPTSLTTFYSGLEGAGVYKKTASDDWTASNSGLTNLNVKALAIKNGSTLFVGTDGGGVFKSIDGGANWNACGATANAAIRSLLIVGNSLYAGTTNGVEKSTNDCATWSDFSTGLPVTP
jgi:hypothetical protein